MIQLCGVEKFGDFVPDSVRQEIKGQRPNVAGVRSVLAINAITQIDVTFYDRRGKIHITYQSAKNLIL